MPNYRLYYLTPENHIVNHMAYAGPDDLSALEKARSLAREHSIEIWESKRRVALVKMGDVALNDNDPCSL